MTEARNDHGSPIAHLPSLDGVRGLAIAAVMALHFAPFTTDARSSIERALIALLRVGWIGVDLFFVLSGFLITTILIRSKTSKSYFRSFYARRALRIFPLYYAVLLAFAVAAPFLATLDPPSVAEFRADQAWLWVYGQNFVMALRNEWLFEHGPIRLTHFWSLAVEEHFYLVWPLVVLVTSSRRLVFVCLAVFVAALACRVWAWHSLGPIAPYVLTPCRADALAAGACLAALREEGRPRLVLRASAIAAIFGAVGVLAIAVTTRRFNRGDAAVTLFGPTLIAAIFTWVVANAVEGPKRFQAALSGPTLRLLGRYSYGLYVYHWILTAILDPKLPVALVRTWVPVPVVPVLLRLVLCSVSALAVAWLSWRVLEQPMLKLKERFPYRGASRVPTNV